MLLGLEDFDIDMFLTFEDENIELYYSDLQSIPELAKYVPLGSFDDEDGSFLFINLDFNTRLEVGMLYMLRDLYAYKNEEDKKTYIDVEIFWNEFYNIPEVTEFFKKYAELCANWGKTDQFGRSTIECPKEWLGWHDDWCLTTDPHNTPDEPRDDLHYIDWNVYPDWCDTCQGDETPPEWCLPCYPTDKRCPKKIPIDVIPPQDLYFLILVYFNGIYRTRPQEVQNFGLYKVLTDIDFELNNYSLIVDIKEFFTREFQWYLQIMPGDLPFGCDYGTHIKIAVQTKNDGIRQIEVQNELEFFIVNFNRIWGELVEIDDINIISRESNTGGDSWLIDVQAKIKQERLIYRIEI